MNTFAHLQDNFLTYALSPDNDTVQLLAEQLNQGKHLSTLEQIHIYRQSIYDGLINALKQIYPVCEKLTGDIFFNTMAEQFILQNDPGSENLVSYSDSLPDFIANYKAAKSTPYLADLSKLERAYHRAFHAQNEDKIDMETIYKHSAEQLSKCIFSLPSSHELITSPYPVDRIWKTHQPHELSNLNIEYSGYYFLVFRKAYSIHIERLSQLEFEFLNTIKSHIPFIDIYAQLAKKMDASALLVHCLLKGWINKIQF